MVSVIDQPVVTLRGMVTRFEIQDVLVCPAHIERAGRILQMLFYQHGGVVLHARHAKGELRLHTQHLHRAEILLEHLPFAVEKTYLLTNQASHDETWLHSRDARSIHDGLFVFQDGLFQHGPSGIVHPRDQILTVICVGISVIDLYQLLTHLIILSTLVCLRQIHLGSIEHAVGRIWTIGIVLGLQYLFRIQRKKLVQRSNL